MKALALCRSDLGIQYWQVAIWVGALGHPRENHPSPPHHQQDWCRSNSLYKSINWFVLQSPTNCPSFPSLPGVQTTLSSTILYWKQWIELFAIPKVPGSHSHLDWVFIFLCTQNKFALSVMKMVKKKDYEELHVNFQFVCFLGFNLQHTLEIFDHSII